ncbi:MAG TPA: cbb3-type cytochrome c oxidase subunit I, partial [Bryobacteraceae bacterium]|nr:cbb3-type cytochrome c oxidase subunit I [Bryobacteraceae bacterium]
EYGSILGHGAYLGPDFTADYLHRAAQFVIARYAREGAADPGARAIADFKTNRYDPATDTLAYTAGQAAAFDELLVYYRDFFAEPSTRYGLRPRAISDPSQARQLTAFFSWSAWAASARRPGLSYSYTNNWPPESLVDNHATADTIVWSVLSLVALLGGIGLLLGAFGRWNFLGWHGRERRVISFRPPGSVFLSASQRACAWFFFVMAVLFLLQTLLGGATQHYRADLTDFFGIDLARVLPFNLARTWHLQLAIFWVATSYLAAGIFLVPMITGGEPARQHWLVYGLLGALALVVFGSLIGEYAGIQGWIRQTWYWFGDQGFEYLDLGRFWQILLTAGLAVWAAILFRGLRGRLRSEHLGNMPWLFFFSALSIPAFYAVGLLAWPTEHFTATDFWRFWVVHLWVEDFLELFTTVIVAYMFVLIGVVHERVALTMIYLDILLYSAGGVIGSMHHVYFSGEPAVHMALGAFFSAAEVIPLTFLTLDAWSFLQLGTQQGGRSAAPFPHLWAVMFLASVGFWNFLGAGIFGFLINLPIVSYYEIGTALTANHGHAAMMGVYGMLAVGLALFCLRYMVPPESWSDRAAKISFWSLNLGLAWMVFATLFPLGLLQLYHSVSQSYFDARSLKFIMSPTNGFFEWLRLPGDAVFIIGGVLPILYLCWLGIRYRGREAAEPGTRPALFTEIAEPEEIGR